MIRIVQIQMVLGDAGYVGVADNDPAKYKCRSPCMGRPIIVPMDVSDILPVRAIQHLLRDEPSREHLIEQMRD